MNAPLLRYRRIVIGAALLTAAACASGPKDAPSPSAPTAPPSPVYRLDDILGAAPDAIDARLGPPALIRREGKGEYRRYRLAGCALIVLLYPDETGLSRAAHVDAAALTSDDSKPDLEACLAGG